MLTGCPNCGAAVKGRQYEYCKTVFSFPISTAQETINNFERIKKMTKQKTNSLLVGYDFSTKPNGKDASVLIVGEKDEKGVVQIINAFQGKEAEEIYKKLTTKQVK